MHFNGYLDSFSKWDFFSNEAASSWKLCFGQPPPLNLVGVHRTTGRSKQQVGERLEDVKARKRKIESNWRQVRESSQMAPTLPELLLLVFGWVIDNWWMVNGSWNASNAGHGHIIGDDESLKRLYFILLQFLFFIVFGVSHSLRVFFQNLNF